MGAIESSLDVPSFMVNTFDHHFVNVPEILPGDDPAIQTGLIADEDDSDVVLPQPSQGLESIRIESEFAGMLDIIWAIFIDHAVSVEEQKRAEIAYWRVYPDEHEVFLKFLALISHRGLPSGNHANEPQFLWGQTF
jgi:hypothetical protein